MNHMVNGGKGKKVHNTDTSRTTYRNIWKSNITMLIKRCYEVTDSHRRGGIYIDSDVLSLKSFEPLLESGPFIMGQESNVSISWVIV